MKTRKTVFLMLLLFSLAIYAQRKNGDTLANGNRDCTAFHKEQQLYVDTLTKEGKNINYSGLNQLVIQNIIDQYIPSKNLVIFLDSQFQFSSGCPMDELRTDICSSQVNVNNPNYSESDFWSPQTLKLLNTNLDKNIIPQIIYNSFPYSINEEKKYNNNDDTSSYILSLDNGYYLKQKYHVLHNKEKTPVNLSMTNSLKVTIGNFPGGKVKVSVSYNLLSKKPVLQMMTFEYKNKKWSLISNEVEGSKLL